ncbi:MAG: hypothetical protein HZA53_11680 [Planctomycetes bacterium]|nr:hypothetical protein [Planctomycetota bacterium]
MNKKHRISTLLLSLPLVLLTLLGCTGTLDRGTALEPHVRSGTVQLAGLGDWGSSAGLLVSPSLIRSVQWVAGASQLRVHSDERHPQTEEWFSWDSVVSLPINVYCAGGRHANDVLVAGTDGNDTLILRQITIPVQPGAYYVDRQAASGPIGSGFVTPATTVRLQRPFVPPSQRAISAPLTSTEVYRGPGIGRVLQLVVDPDRRFVWLLTDQNGGALYRHVLGQGTSPTRYLAATDSPVLSTVGCSMIMLDHSDLGRVLRLDEGALLPGRDCVWIWDQQNDGVPDGWDHMDGWAFQDAYPDREWSRIFDDVF